MKQLWIALFCVLCLTKNRAQTFLNGDFENNSAGSCSYNLTDSIFNTKISNVFAFGKKYIGPALGNLGESDLQTYGCLVTPQSGNWCVGLAADSSSSDAVALELSAGLIVGQVYPLSFYVYSNANFNLSPVNLKIGCSDTDSTFGQLLLTEVPIANTWKHVVFSFTVSQSYKYITVSNVSGSKGWNQIDHFELGSLTQLPEINASSYRLFPNPCTETLNLQSSSALNKATFSLYNALGQKVMCIGELNGQINTLQLSPELGSGIYVAELREEDQLVLRQKIMLAD